MTNTNSATQTHPDAPWSQQAIQDALDAVHDHQADAPQDEERYPSEADAAQAILDSLDPSEWSAPDGVSLDVYLDAIRYELRGIARKS